MLGTFKVPYTTKNKINNNEINNKIITIRQTTCEIVHGWVDCFIGDNRSCQNVII